MIKNSYTSLLYLFTYLLNLKGKFEILYNLYFKRVTPITMKSILPSGPLKTKWIIINYNNHDKKSIHNGDYNKRS